MGNRCPLVIAFGGAGDTGNFAISHSVQESFAESYKMQTPVEPVPFTLGIWYCVNIFQ